MIFFILKSFCIFLFSLIFLYIFIYSIQKYIIDRNKYKYNDYIHILNFFLEESYSIIYENDLIVYSSNGVRDIPKDEKETIERNFIKQSLLLMGPKNEKLIFDFFGDKRSMITYMIRFIRKKFNNDAIIKIIKKEEK